MTTATGYASVSVTHQGRDNNLGMSESISSGPTLEEAKAAGEQYAINSGADPATLHWKQTSERSWILMDRGIHGGVLVYWVTPQVTP
jgi:hypothetical protein